MTKQEAMRLTHQENVLMELGFTADEAAKLRRISMTLRRWHELECGDGRGYIERDETTGKPFYINCNSRYVSANDPRARHAIADREAGARRRLNAIIARRNNTQNAIGATYQNTAGRLAYYVQGDPRGVALYILRPGDIPEGQTADSCYSRGICVY